MSKTIETATADIILLGPNEELLTTSANNSQTIHFTTPTVILTTTDNINTFTITSPALITN